MAEEKEKKLGPNVTYLGNHDEDKEAVTMLGIRFKPGESVNLVDRLGEEKAQTTLKSLAGNRFFKVDGGPDHQAEQKKKAEAEKKQAEAEEKDREEQQKEQQEKNQGQEAARSDRERQGRLPPDADKPASATGTPVTERRTK